MTVEEAKFSSVFLSDFEKNNQYGVTKFGRRIKKSLEQKQNCIQVFILIF